MSSGGNDDQGATGGVAPGSTLVGRYRVTKALGKGGMASVWEGEHLRLGQRVAIKVLHAELAEHADLVARFEREGRAIAKLRTRHVVRVLDVDTTESGAPFLVMECLTGRALDAELAERGPLPIREAVSAIIEACTGVAEAHALGVVHRDLKPANLFLAEENGGRVVKVLDFGISRDALDDDVRLTATQAIMGTPLYMAPEQFRGPSGSVDRNEESETLPVRRSPFFPHESCLS